MPELPEVEIVRLGLNQLTTGQIIRGGEVLLNRTLAYPLSVAEFWQGIQNTKVICWQRRGKYLLAELENNSNQPAGKIGVHLRMTGQLLWLPQNSPLQKHTRLRWFLGENQELRFVDIRTFGKVWWVPPNTTPSQIITGLQKLGPEPLTSDFSLEYLAQKLEGRKGKIKNLLLNQSIIAGIGNIYADEALFKSGIRPDAIGADLSLEQLERLRLAIIEILQQAIAQGGTTFSDFRNVVGINGNYGNIAWVYRRSGEPCRVCGTLIKRLKLAGRTAHFCPQCQSYSALR